MKTRERRPRAATVQSAAPSPPEFDDPVAACFDRALRILAERSHSVLQIRRKLIRRTFEPEVVDAVITRLLAENYLDEARFASELVRARSRRGSGSLRITRDLQAAGVDNELARRTLREELSDDARVAAVLAVAKKKLQTLVRRHGEAGLEDDTIKRKLGAFLAARGFETGDIIQAIDQSYRDYRDA